MNSLALAGIGILAYAAGCVTCYFFIGQTIDRLLKVWRRRRQAAKRKKTIEEQFRDFELRAIKIFLNEEEKRILKDYPYVLTVSHVPYAFLLEAKGERHTVMLNDCMGVNDIEEYRHEVRYATNWVKENDPQSGLILFLTLAENRELFLKKFNDYVLPDEIWITLAEARWPGFNHHDTN